MGPNCEKYEFIIDISYFINRCNFESHVNYIKVSVFIFIVFYSTDLKMLWSNITKDNA